MVAPAGVPLLKLGLLAVKQIAKPIANRAKVAAKDSAAFKGAVVWVGRSLHRLTIQMGRMADGKVSLEYITPLREEAAVDRGAEFVSELVIYSIAASTTIYEFTRQQQARSAAISAVLARVLTPIPPLQDKKKKEKEAELEEIRIKQEALANERRQ